MNNKVIIISSPSGGGKGTIISRLLDWNNQLVTSVSATTRKIRKGEQEGINYYYINTEDVQEKIQNNELLEYEEVYSGTYYGTLKSELERLWDLGKIIIFEIDVDGSINLKKKFKDNALSIFINPPSLEILYQRLKNRGSEDQNSLEERMRRAEYEIKMRKNFDHIVLNDDLEKAVDDTKNIINKWLS